MGAVVSANSFTTDPLWTTVLLSTSFSSSPKLQTTPRPVVYQPTARLGAHAAVSTPTHLSPNLVGALASTTDPTLTPVDTLMASTRPPARPTST
jgi:hypothetical protein